MTVSYSNFTLIRIVNWFSYLEKNVNKISIILHDLNIMLDLQMLGM